MTIHWKAFEEHFLMVPLVFQPLLPGIGILTKILSDLQVLAF
jgi:hypothetical protein